MPIYDEKRHGITKCEAAGRGHHIGPLVRQENLARQVVEMCSFCHGVVQIIQPAPPRQIAPSRGDQSQPI